MNAHRRHGGSARAAWLAAALALAGPLAGAARANEFGPWLWSSLNSLYFTSVPVVGEPATLVMAGRFGFPCGRSVDARVLDQEHIALTFQFTSGCTDTLDNWSESFDLGPLPAGSRQMWVALTVQRPDSADVFETSHFTFDVQDTTPPPPPPPPPAPRPRIITGWWTLPQYPNIKEPTAVVVEGRSPIGCVRVVDPSVGSDLVLQATLAPDSSCTDTSGAHWTQRFDLGVLPEGSYSSLIVVHVLGDTIQGRTSYAFSVVDPDAPPPPPPPPPTDSLDAALSPTRPNPFALETTFSVSLDDRVPVDVGIYDLSGRRVATVLHGWLPRGTSNLVWNGRRDDGSWAPSGLYFYRLVMPGRVVSRRVVRLAPGG